MTQRNVEYLSMIYFFHRCCFVRCFINQVFHFDITITSRVEDEHSILKHQLSSFNEDFKTVMNDINLLLKNELNDHFIAVKEIKNRFFMKFRKSIFQQLIAHISFLFFEK